MEASERWVTLRVQDNGIGIPRTLLPHIFDLFTQADQSLARSHGGLGIGLTLVKRLIEMHGGRVEAHSEGPGHGAEFLLHLPQPTAPAQLEKNAAPSDEIVEVEAPRRVLVVDDNQDAAESLALLLRVEGHTVAVAFDGATALAEAARFQPQAVLLDIGMPGMDGYQVVRELRSRELTRSAVILALTGYGNRTTVPVRRRRDSTIISPSPSNPVLLLSMLKANLTS